VYNNISWSLGIGVGTVGFIVWGEGNGFSRFPKGLRTLGFPCFDCSVYYSQGWCLGEHNLRVRERLCGLWAG
jgi:hypothetical protein